MTTPRTSLRKWTSTVALMLFASAAVAQTPCSLTCPASATIASAPGADTAIFPYSTPTSSGTCSGSVVQTAGLPPPSPSFGVGTTTNCFAVPNEASCCFSVTVTQTPAAPVVIEVPTMSMTALVLLILVLAAGTLFMVRRRHLNRKD